MKPGAPPTPGADVVAAPESTLLAAELARCIAAPWCAARGVPDDTGGGYVHSRLLASQARQVVFGPVLTHLTFDRLQRTQAIEERMFLTGGGSMVAVLRGRRGRRRRGTSAGPGSAGRAESGGGGRAGAGGQRAAGRQGGSGVGAGGRG